MTVRLMQEETHRILRQREEAIEWALQQFLKQNPTLSKDDIEIVYLEGNPFAYHFRASNVGSQSEM